VSATSIEIHHDEAAQRFEAVVEGLRCECAYYHQGDTVVFVHTEVPPQLQGRGLAAQLVEAALDWARASGLKVRPACSYVATYMRRHPQTLDLMA
jgi:uncharacterized protein